ncbi:hypothetical protein GVN21_06675 [Caulobacter sp. SLTY]|uniref:DUF6249 domain-containing protein n=1 Tax=Caulobacter sp. SLTY TaxID=2683262 RepID=UPI0014130673|nr:DUF6249 domain-containing protein [Caulobacter sp. SLTY]NBB15037.1 hypothetical protein [Caulobacter sp. SLTY]
MEILIPLAFFAMIAAIVLVPGWLKSRERSEMQSTLRAAIDRGQDVPQEIIDAMTKNVKTAPTALSDIRAGIIWIAIGLGIGVMGYLISYEADGALHPMLGIGAIPVIIGLAYVVLSFFNPNKGNRS